MFIFFFFFISGWIRRWKTPVSTYLKEPQVSFYFLIPKGDVNCCTFENVCISQSRINFKKIILHYQFKLDHGNMNLVLLLFCSFVLGNEVNRDITKGDCFGQFHNVNFKKLEALSPNPMPPPLGLVAHYMP